MIKFNPALFDTLSTRYNWLMFEKTCSTAMDMTRSIILMQSKDKHLFHGINEELSKINAYQLKYSFSPVKKNEILSRFDLFKNYRQLIYEACDAKKMIKKYLELSSECKKRIKRIVYYGSTFFPNVSEMQWLECIGVSYHGYHHFIHKSINKCSYTDFVLLNQYVYTCYQKNAITSIPLTIEWVTSQYQTIANQHQGKCPPTAGIYYICPSCRKIKGFVVNKTTQKKIYWATGHEKIAYDYETNRVFCAHKNIKLREKPSLKRNKQLSREIRRKDELHCCRETECIPVSLLGKIVQSYGKCYVLCPKLNCGRLCTFEFSKHSEVGFSCGQCHLSNNPTSSCCFFCGTKHKLSSKKLFILDGGESKPISLCQKHSHRNLYQRSDAWNHIDLRKAIEKNTRIKLG